MHSFIIISENSTKRKDYIDAFCREKEISKFDQKLFTPEDASFGVALVRDIRTAEIRGVIAVPDHRVFNGHVVLSTFFVKSPTSPSQQRPLF